jgi:hypothetical protein
MRKILLLGAAIASSGCSTLTKEFDNRLACDSAGKAYVVSMYGPLGIASKVDDQLFCKKEVK